MPANQARRDLAKKLQFEAIFRGEVRIGFLRELSIFSRDIVLEDRLLNPQGLRELWFGIVNKQFNRVVPHFSRSNDLFPIEQDILAANLAKFTRKAVLQDSGAIFKTSVKNMLLAKKEALVFLKENSIDVTPITVDRVGSRILGRLQAPRVNNITVTETQTASEGAKKETATVEQKNRKEWFTVSDAKVRPAHVIAHGQVRLMGLPFEVGNQKLRYPGDTSLGASVGNVAFCRCAAIYG